MEKTIKDEFNMKYLQTQYSYNSQKIFVDILIIILKDFKII